MMYVEAGVLWEKPFARAPGILALQLPQYCTRFWENGFHKVFVL